MKNILVATEKPFAPAAIIKMQELAEESDFQFTLLENYTDKQQLIDAAKAADGMIIRSDKADKEVLEAVKGKLKIVVRAGAGYDNIDCKVATDCGIVAMNTPGQNSNAVAELAFGMMCYMARNKFSAKAGIELKGKKLGIHAYGNVGRNVARIAQGFDTDVRAFDAFVPQEKIEMDNVKAMDSAEDLYHSCQYISLNIPANIDTVKSIDYELLSQMPENAVLVNTARKEVINEEELLKLMNERDDFIYISDIAPANRAKFEQEFPDRVFFTPKKMGAQTAEANINAGVAAVSQIINFFDNGDTTFKVN